MVINNMIKVLYVGDFIKANGPSNVDISIRNTCEHLNFTDVKFIQSNETLSINTLRLFFKTDIVHVSGISFLGVLLVLLSKVFFKRTSLTTHGLLKLESQYREVSKKRILFENLLIRLVDRIFPVSPLLAKEFGSHKVTVIPNGIERKKVSYIEKDRKLITLIGGGRKEKRHLDVCKVVAKINAAHDLGIKVSIYGEKGTDSEALNKFDFVQDFGFCPKEDIEHSLNRSNIFIQYTVFESFSLAIAEAINHGCKIIASDKVGINDYIISSPCYRVVNSQEKLEQSILDMTMNDYEYKIDEHLLSWTQVTQEYYNNWNNL